MKANRFLSFLVALTLLFVFALPMSSMADDQVAAGAITKQSNREDPAKESATKKEIITGADEYNGHSYYIFHNEDYTWEDAENYCESMGGHLATITSAGENSFLFQCLSKSGLTKSAYFGLFRIGDNWKWVTGEEVSYTNWHSGEPSKGYKEEHGMYFYQFNNDTWNDGYVSGSKLSERNFICEWDYTADPYPEIIAGPVQFDYLHYSFSNSYDDFSPSLDSYGKIPYSCYELMYPETIIIPLLIYMHAGTWNGSCQGMVSTASLYNYTNGNLKLNEFGVKTISQLSTASFAEAYNLSATDIINAFQISWRRQDPEYDIGKVYSNIVAGIKSGEVPTITVWGMIGTDEAGHCVIPYKVKKLSDTLHWVYVYDPNYPNSQNRVIPFTMDQDGNAIGWSYVLNDEYQWGTGLKNAAIATVQPSNLNSIWKGRARKTKEISGWQTSSYNKDFQIVDRTGKILGTVTNGYFTSHDSSVYTKRTIEDGKGSDPIIYSNNVDFTVVNTGSGPLSADTAGTDQGAFIKTDAKSIAFDINNAASRNAVTLDSVKGDSFQATFYSYLSTASGNNKVEISGKSEGAEVTIGLSGSDVIVNNCTDLSISVNDNHVTDLETLGNNINFYDVRLDYTEAAYTGQAIKPGIKVKGKDLKGGTDYRISYRNNIGSASEATTAAAIIEGIGSYSGTKTLLFTITPNGKNLKNCKIAAIKDQTYTGKAITPKVTVTYKGTKLTKDKDYAITWKNNKKIGTATLTITGRGLFTGTKTTTFRIIPKSVKLSSLKAGKKQLSVSWKKGQGIDGYEIEYSLKKNFKGSKKITVSKAKTTTYTIKKLKAKKTYYVRIRAFKKVKGKKYYSEWSKTLSKKVK